MSSIWCNYLGGGLRTTLSLIPPSLLLLTLTVFDNARGSSVVYAGEQVFRIEIADKNDHPPHFTQSVYEAEEIPEDANLNALVTEVKALDDDTASPVSYSIVEGNIYNAFLIESTTGKIKVNSQLDYENITNVSVFRTVSLPLTTAAY